MSTQRFDLIVIGGGAAGFFAAINTALMNPACSILILEKSSRLLAKVKVSGGGRCNVTHHCFNPTALSAHYPRGKKQLKNLFRTYQAEDVVKWFAAKGVKLKAEEDGRMFPVTDSSQTIIDCFLDQVSHKKIQIEKNFEVENIISSAGGFQVVSTNSTRYAGRYVLIATGGSAKATSYSFIQQLGHTIIPPIPSLFTFNDHEKKFKDLMGVAVSNGLVRIAGTKFFSTGPVLITHWGLSGPAVIRLSAWAATYLHEQHYQFTALVSWIGSVNEEELRSTLAAYKAQHPKKRVMLNALFDLPQRLWIRLCEQSGIAEEKTWNELPVKNMNKLIEALIRSPFEIKGKTTFKEEFVTCGGVDLDEIELSSMESKKVKGLFFAGEVLNIDGETGGFNFQAAWTTGYIAARAIASRI